MKRKPHHLLKKSIIVITCAMLISSCWAQVKHLSVDEQLQQLNQNVSILETDIGSLSQQLQQLKATIGDLGKIPGGMSGVAISSVPTTTNIEDLPFEGSSSAKVVLIEYVDLECPFCASFEREVYPKIVNNYIKTGKIRYMFRDFPLQNHKGAVLAARAVRCAGEQGKLWEMRDGILTMRVKLFDQATSGSVGVDSGVLTKCLSSAKYADVVAKDVSEAQHVGIDRTPTFLLGIVNSATQVVNVKSAIRGVYPYETFRMELDKVLSVASEQ